MKKKGFIECLTDFMSDTEGLTQEEIATELEELGVDIAELATAAHDIAKRGSAARRLDWRTRAKDKRMEIEELLKCKQMEKVASGLKDKVREILTGSYSQEALFYVEAYFRKRDSFSEKEESDA
jgi:predicted transcriptional regulator